MEMPVVLAGSSAVAVLAFLLLVLLDPHAVVRLWERWHERRRISKRYLAG